VKAPFPWFGGKSRVADVVWRAFGDVPVYIEPFFGSGAVLLARPHAPRIETVNDIDCYIANFWRAIQSDPEQVASYADWPVNEADLHARHLWLVSQGDWRERMKTDPDYFDPKIAGWWVWGISQWIGSGWCAKELPGRQRPSINAMSAGMGVHRVKRQRPHVCGDNTGIGVHRLGQQMPHVDGNGHGRGVHSRCEEHYNRKTIDLIAWFDELAARMRRVRVCCGDWKRITGPACLGAQKPAGHASCGVFLDPPYSAPRAENLYNTDSMTVAHDVRAWALEHGSDRRLRIALCGYEGEHEMPESWNVYEWEAVGGYGLISEDEEATGRANKGRERMWFSPHCLVPVNGHAQPKLVFADV
jgi:site-specific DNA-adenine methylase